MNLTRWISACAALAMLVCFALPAEAANIRAVKVEGSERIDPETVKSYINVKAGDAFDADRLNEALRALYTTGLFADVSLYQEADDLVIVVVENPIINEVRFEGNDEVKEEMLLAETQMRPRMVLTRTKVQADVDRLEMIYRVSGRFSATVTPKIIKLDQNRVNLIYEISEGPETLITRVHFLGNKRYDDTRLTKVIRSKEERWWRFWTTDDKYDPDRLEYDKELLRQFYFEHGYADFNVENAVAELSPDRRYFYVTFTLDEGSRYKVGNINLESGLPGLDAEKLRDKLTFKPGDWYNSKEVELTVNALTAAVEQMQYPFVDVVPMVDRDRESKTISINFKLNEGRKVFVENINIKGNARTLDEVIRREVTMAEGDPFNRAKLKKSEQRIKDLGFFDDKTLSVKPVPGSAPDKTNIDIEVAEKSTGAISIGAGYSTNDGVLGDFQLREKNFLGKGQVVSLGMTLASRRTEFDFSFTEPYFLRRDLSAGFDVYHTTRDYQDESSYDSKSTGGALRLGYPMSDHLRHSFAYRFDETEINNIPAGASVYIKQQEGTYATSALLNRFTYDTTDSKEDPTEGVIFRVDADVSGLGGDSAYLKGRVGGTYFYPIADKWVASVLGEVGYTAGWGGKDIRITERFYLGGDTLRGFESAGVGPRDTATLDSLGANRFWRGSLQLDMPSGLPEDLGVRTHIFTDFGAAGTVDDSGPTIADKESVRVSVGGGISWRSPMGPVTASIAVPVAKEEFDETEYFRFRFGTRF